MSDFLRQFAHTFASLDKDNLSQLGQLYHHAAVFTDPLHEVRGLDNIHAYFAQMYANVSELHFEFYAFDQTGEGQGYLRWAMRYRHPRLAGGRMIRLEGCSHLLWSEGKVYQHRDYFDAGALLYEQLPVFGAVIRWLKRRLA
jgi:limonene-1,2-epoxide hydrolase